jgi:uncharacterized lipoprotein YajG
VYYKKFKLIIKYFCQEGRLLFPVLSINTKSFTNKHITMKKLLLVLAIGSFAACNGSSSTETKVDSAATTAKDSVNTMADSAKAKIDSTASAAKDSVKSKVDSAAKKK